MSKENNLVAVDFETYYDSEYSLTAMSVRNYLHDTRFNAYLVAVYDGEGINYTGHPSGFDWSQLNGMVICAHNASFDEQVYMRLVETGLIKTPVEGARWICTADLAAWLGVKRDLATAAKHLLGRELSKTVRAKMKGRSASELSEDATVLAYGNKDAVTCYDLAAQYLGAWPEKEQKISQLNREAGYHGVAVDPVKIMEGIRILSPKLSEAESSLPWVAQGEKPLSANAIKSYASSLGIPVPSSFAKDSEEFLAWLEKYGPEYPWAKAVGEYRSINTLINRIKSLRDGRNPKTNRFPYGIKYMGAFTGRFSGGSAEGGGKFNCQNMPRKAMYGVDVRPMFRASPGKTLLIADYNQVEARYLLWRVGDTAALAPCFQGKSIYQAYAEHTGLCDSDTDLKETNDKLYKLTKARVLGLGYQSGGPKFRAFAATNYKVFLTEKQAQDSVDEFRERNPRIVRFWAEHHAALAYSARCKDETHQVELKSGRILTYYEPRYTGREMQAYQFRGEPKAYLYGGKLTENEVQASCRDILCEAWLACVSEGYFPILNVHDELVFEIDKGTEEKASADIRRLMTTCSPWAEGLPLGVDIVLSDVYAK